MMVRSQATWQIGWVANSPGLCASDLAQTNALPEFSVPVPEHEA